MNLIMPAFILLSIGLIGVFFAWHRDQANKRREQALARLMKRQAAPGEDQTQHPVSEARSQGSITSRLKRLGRQKNGALQGRGLVALIAQAGLETPVYRFWLYSTLFALVMLGVFVMMKLSNLVIILLGFSCFFGLPRFFLKFRASRRQKAFLHDFADALEAMIRLLKAGMPMTEAITMVGNEFSGPVGEEMSRIARAQKLGTPIGEAVAMAGYRIPLPEVKMFATAVTIQAQTGSSLSEVLGNLAGVIRARYRLKRKVLALSSEAKVSAMIIAALPVMVTGALYLVNRDYISLLWTHPTGQSLLTGALVWMAVGVVIMRQMINFKV